MNMDIKCSLKFGLKSSRLKLFKIFKGTLRIICNSLNLDSKIISSAVSEKALLQENISKMAFCKKKQKGIKR